MGFFMNITISFQSAFVSVGPASYLMNMRSEDEPCVVFGFAPSLVANKVFLGDVFFRSTYIWFDKPQLRVGFAKPNCEISVSLFSVFRVLIF
jgi:hypothetical protein